MEGDGRTCPRGFRHRRSAKRSLSTPSTAAITKTRSAGTGFSRSPRPFYCRSSLCWRLGPATRRRSGARSHAWALPRPRPRGPRRAGRTSGPSTSGISTPRPSRHGSRPTPSTTSRRWPSRSIASVPSFRVAFDAWRATNPETNPNAPRGPTFMPQYHQPGASGGKMRWTTRRTRRLLPARAMVRPPTNTFEQRCTSRASYSLSASARTSRCVDPLRAHWARRCDAVFSLVLLTQLPGPPT